MLAFRLWKFFANLVPFAVIIFLGQVDSKGKAAKMTHIFSSLSMQEKACILSISGAFW